MAGAQSQAAAAHWAAVYCRCGGRVSHILAVEERLVLQDDADEMNGRRAAGNQNFWLAPKLLPSVARWVLRAFDQPSLVCADGAAAASLALRSLSSGA